ncbi:MAG: hypothetical protein J1F29_05675 [Lentimicrobiaceae bacterium]|nr:hypothetical protein [Lentimicrobiaceae bacterium]
MHTIPKVQIWLITAAALLAVSCVKHKEFPPEPYLEFRRNILGAEQGVGGDTVLTLAVEFYFQDGDGDIGRKDEVEREPYVGEYFHNLHFNLEEMLSDSTYEQVYQIDSTGQRYPIVYLYHLHYMEPVNGNNSLSGTITWQVDDFASTAFFMRGKTVRYGFYLYDRALHKSNVVYTDPIKL